MWWTASKKAPADAAASGSVRSFVEAKVRGNTVVVFTKSTCGYCRMAMRLLDKLVKLGVQQGVLSGTTKQLVDNVVLNEMEAGGEVQAELTRLTGQRTVPYIFIKQRFVGGFSELAGEVGNDHVFTRLDMKTPSVEDKDQLYVL